MTDLYIEAPIIYGGEERSVFFGGGISGCPDWQASMRRLLTDTGLVVLNPRRGGRFDPCMIHGQIRWEHDHLRKATARLFWFCEETVQPIALYELGAWSMTQRPLFVGVHPNYERRRDVQEQTGLVRSDVSIANSIVELAEQVRAWSRR